MPATDAQGLEVEGKRSHHPSSMAKAQTPPRVEVPSTQASQIPRPKHLVRDSDGKPTGEEGSEV